MKRLVIQVEMLEVICEMMSGSRVSIPRCVIFGGSRSREGSRCGLIALKRLIKAMPTRKCRVTRFTAYLTLEARRLKIVGEGTSTSTTTTVAIVGGITSAISIVVVVGLAYMRCRNIGRCYCHVNSGGLLLKTHLII